MRNFVLLPFAAFLALAPAAHAQSASFIVSQHGKAVGTASFGFTANPAGFDSTALVIINMKGLDYSLSKTERLSTANHLRNVQLSAAVNGSAVNVTASRELKAGQAPVLLLDISANGHTTTTRLPAHSAAVFLPDFDPGALETLLAIAVTRNNSDLWAIIPKKEGSIVPIQLATYADEKGTLDGNPVVVHHLVATFAGSETDLFSSPENQLLQAEFPKIGFALIRKGFVLTPSTKPGAPPADLNPAPSAKPAPTSPTQQPPVPAAQPSPAPPAQQPPAPAADQPPTAPANPAPAPPSDNTPASPAKPSPATPANPAPVPAPPQNSKLPS
jgi:hypothetical protein